MSDEIHPSPELYCVEITRKPRDLGVSIVLPATCHLMARREAFRLFPEYKHSHVLMRVFPVQYIEIDWESGRSIVVKRRRPPETPPCIALAAKRERKRLLPPLEEEGDAQ